MPNYLSIYLSIYLASYPYIVRASRVYGCGIYTARVTQRSIFLPIYLYPSILLYLPSYLSMYASIHPSLYPSIHLGARVVPQDGLRPGRLPRRHTTLDTGAQDGPVCHAGLEPQASRQVS